MLQLSIWSITPLLSALVLSTAYAYLRHNLVVPGAHAARLVIVAALVWSAAEFLITLVTSLPTKILLATISGITMALMPVAWFAFALSYAAQRRFPNRSVLNLACAVPLITVGLMLTNSAHHLVWQTLTLVESAGHVGLVREPGPWLRVHTAYGSALALIGATLLTFALSQSRQTIGPIIAVIVAPAAVLAAQAFETTDLNPYPFLNLSAVGLTIATLCISHGVLRYGLLDHLPVLRDQVVEHLSDGVVVIRRDGLIIDANSAALTILSLERAEVGRKAINNVVKTMPLANLNERQLRSVEVSLNERAFEVSSSAIEQNSAVSELILVFRDVTERRESERQLQYMKSELETMAHTDALTRLFNRWVFMERLQQEVERVRRHGSALSVLLFDLDHFKLVNDTYGHSSGDQVLQRVAKVSLDVKRVTDVAARLGGEEFALLLPETRQAGALQLGQRLREAIEAAVTINGSGTLIRVTASIGVATVTRDSEHLDSILKWADKALYEAKDQGRNRVQVAA